MWGRQGDANQGGVTGVTLTVTQQWEDWSDRYFAPMTHSWRRARQNRIVLYCTCSIWQCISETRFHLRVQEDTSIILHTCVTRSPSELRWVQEDTSIKLHTCVTRSPGESERTTALECGRSQISASSSIATGLQTASTWLAAATLFHVLSGDCTFNQVDGGATNNQLLKH